MHQRIKETLVKRLLVWLAAACLLPLSAAAQNVTYIHTDALGSPVLETNAQAQVVRQVDYRAYGMEVMDAPRPGPGYTGHYRDVGTGLVYMQQRYYDPVIGRFLSVDPVPTDVTNGDAFNRFRYASNNPFRFIDPDGRKDRELPKELTRQGYESIGDGKVVRVDEVNVRGESRFEVHVYEDSKDFRSAAADGNTDGLRKHEVNTLNTDGEWGKHGKGGSAPDLGKEGQRGFNRVIQREVGRRGLNTPSQLQSRGFGRFARFLGPAAAVVGYLGDNSVNSVCSQGDPGGGVCD